ncbi:MAG: YIP1 family protein [Defluviitaleaceae bacterium]|nr:YIP1 family protein [Defluviitaleaceae bacterium]
MNEPFNDQNQQNHEELTRVVEPEIKKMGAVQRIVSLFISPSELMHNIKMYPVVLVPFAVVIVIGLISMVFTPQITEIMNHEISNISIERYGIDLTNLAAQADIYGDTQNNAPDTITLVSGVIGAIVLPLLICFFSALGILILSKIAGGDATLGQLFSMCMHIYIIYAIGALIASALIVMTGNFLDLTSLAAVLMPHGNISMVSFNALSAITIFTVWDAILTFIGIKILNQFGNIRAGILTAIVFLVAVAFHIGTYMFTFIMLDIALAAM